MHLLSSNSRSTCLAKLKTKTDHGQDGLRVVQWIYFSFYSKSICQLHGQPPHFLNIGQGKGIATYFNDKFTHIEDIARETIQISKFSSEYIDSINVYRNQRGLPADLINDLTSLISENKITIITGDFNICSRVKWNNSVSTHLKSLGCKQYQLGPTHIKGGHIDHLYIKHDGPRSIKVETDRYSPYYSDHDGILTILTPQT